MHTSEIETSQAGMRTDVAAKARFMVLQARQPYDAALDAIDLIEANRDQILDLLCKVLAHHEPDIDSMQKVAEMLKAGKFPGVWHRLSDNDLRVDALGGGPGRGGEPGSFWAFVRETCQD